MILTITLLISISVSMHRSVIGFFGHISTLNAGCYGYVSDISSREERTKRMSFATGCITVSIMMGAYFAAFITGAFEDTQLGYYVILFTALALGILGIIYTVFFLEQSIHLDPDKKETFFKIDHITDSFKAIFAIKENRFKKMAAVFIFCSVNMVFVTTDFEYMMGRLKFKNFDRSLFTFYSGTKQGQDGLSLLVLLPLLLSMFRISDLAIMLFGLATTSLGYVLLMVSDEGWPGADWGWPFWVSCALYKYAHCTAHAHLF